MADNADDDDGFILPTDAFVEVLLRLPTSSRRRFRLVCKRWRGIIDERTPERRSRAKILAFFSEAGASRAVVHADDQQDGGDEQEWRFRSSCFDCRTYEYGSVVRLAGTCNGLLCLRDYLPLPCHRIGPTIAVVNPVTGEESAAIPCPPESLSWDYNGGYRRVVELSFGYHPTTGKYKVVRVSCTSESPNKRLEIDSVQVLTLEGKPEWRTVPVLAMDTSYHDTGGVVTVDGSTYWLNARADRVAALDLGDDDERVASFAAPPCLQVLQVPKVATCQLTTVHGRLGVLVTRRQPAMTEAAKVDVWVLEDGGGGGRRRPPPRWSRRWSILQPIASWQGRWVMSPHFTHGEYVLSKRESHSWRDCDRWLYRRKVGDLASGSGKDAELWPLEGAKAIIMRTGDEDGAVVTFPYVETTEPLPI
ncbi:unnamed protein product [Urochloa decumbens]|uniref:F-box domain-containing protein n=1 Tax=Urochloa decumbens TaxID=240449 RepID=A0ABC9BDK3_9POAL